MAETAPWLLQECFTATGARLFTGNIVCGEGVADVVDGSLLVTTGGSGLTLSVAEGGGFVDSDTDDEGMYSIFNDGPVTVTATTADGTNPRIDQVIATVNDAQLSGSDNDWVLSVLAGTPTVGATLTNLTGAAALPDRSIRLAYVLVPAAFAGPFVDATHIRDDRNPYVLCGEPSVPSTQWVRTANQSISNVTETLLTYPQGPVGTAVPNAFYSESGGLVTFGEPGLYLVIVQVTWATNATGYRKMTLYSTGSVVQAQEIVPAVSANGQLISRMPVIVNVTDGMDLSVWVEQSSGGSLNAAGTMRVTRLGTIAA